MLVRILSASVGIVLVIAVLIIGEFFSPLITAALSVVSLILVSELLRAKGLLNNLKISIPTLAFALVMPVLSTTEYFLIPAYIFVLFLFVIMIVFHETVSFTDLSFVFVTTWIVTFSLGTVISVMQAYNFKFNSFFLVLVLGIPWMADAGGYFGGSFFGKHKLCPKISPKKTVEGAVAGVMLGIASAVLIGVVFENLVYPEASVNYVLILIIGVVNSFVSIVGDLSFSLIKRTFHIKDYGQKIPGHGGLLDRFDSVLFTAPVVFILSKFIQIIV